MDVLSTMTLGLGLRVLAEAKSLTFSTTCFMIGIWEGFALHQTTSRRSNTVIPGAAQMLRFAFDFVFFRNPHMLLVTLMLLLVTWTIIDAVAHSQSHQLKADRRTGRRRVKPSPFAYVDKAPHQHQRMEHVDLMAFSKPRVVVRSPSSSSPSRDGDDATVDAVPIRLPASLLERQMEEGQVEQVEAESLSEALAEASEGSSTASMATVNEGILSPPIENVESEPLAESLFHNQLIIEMNKNNEDTGASPPHADFSTPPTTSMPTPPLTPLTDLEVLHVHFPALGIGVDLDEAPPSLEIVDEEVKELVDAVCLAVSTSELESDQDEPLEESPLVSVELNPPETASLVIEEVASRDTDVKDVAEHQYQEAKVHSPAPTVITLDESVISTSNEGTLVKRAGDFRAQAQSKMQIRERLLEERTRALAKRKIRDAFLLALEAKKSQESSLALHKKAERRYFLANNQRRKLTELDLHGLRVQEAIHRTEQAIRNIVINGGGKELKVIVGRGKHSANNQPVLKPVVRQALSKLGLKPSFDRNPGVLKVAIPTRRGNATPSEAPP